MYRDLIILTRAKWRLAEAFYFPLTTIIIWGFFALYSKQIAIQAGLIVLIVNIFWNFAYIAQSTANLQIMEDTWSGSLKQVLLSGISEFEYMAARLLTAIVISMVVMFFILLLSYLFTPELFTHPAQIAELSLITLLGSMALSVVIAAVYIATGREYGFLAWTALQLFILLSAPFNPVSVFPPIMQYIASVMPFTYVFEAARMLATQSSISSVLLTKSLIAALIYFIVGWPLYYFAFKRARRTGGLVRIS